MIEPLITIAITAWNSADTIERAVRSALTQDWPNIEVVAVDDASSDGTAEILGRLAAGHNGLRVLHHEVNRGYPAALNTAIAASRGAFVAIFDDDDDNVPDRLRSQFERITGYERETGARLVFCYTNRSVVKAGHPKYLARAIGRRSPEPHGSAVADFVFRIGADPRFVWGNFGSCTLMARRESFAAIGRFDESFRRCAEWDMAVRAAFLRAHFIGVDRPLVIQYRNQSDDNVAPTRLKYALQLRNKHRDYLRGRRLYLASRALARSKFYGDNRRVWKRRAYRLVALALGPSLIGVYLRSHARAWLASRPATR